jgi:hypothetical protein
MYLAPPIFCTRSRMAGLGLHGSIRKFPMGLPAHDTADKGQRRPGHQDDDGGGAER